MARLFAVPVQTDGGLAPSNAQIHSGGLLRGTPHCVLALRPELSGGISRETFAGAAAPCLPLHAHTVDAQAPRIGAVCVFDLHCPLLALPQCSCSRTGTTRWSRRRAWRPLMWALGSGSRA